MHTNTEAENWLIALLLAGFTVVVLTATARDIGLTWDEPTYIVAAEIYPGWFAELLARPKYALSDEGVTAYWAFNHEHPPLSKVWSGVVWLGARYLFDDLMAHRLGNILLVGMLVALLYLVVAKEYGAVAGLVAAAALITMPRFFFHAHLAALDVPVTVMIFAVTYVFWLGHDRPGPGWTLLLGLVWGLALATKINALFIAPLVLSAWTLLFQAQRYLIIRLALAGVIASAVFLLSWPWLYYNTLMRLADYLGFMTTRHTTVEQFYFGQLYSPPPWHFPFVTTLLVVPLGLLLLAAAGSFSVIRRRPQQPLGGLFLLGALVSLLILATGRGQLFDNERLFMPVFPFLAGLAGLGFAWITQMLRRLAERKGRPLRSGALISLLAMVTFVPHLLLAGDLYPHLLSYYSEAVGGAYGARLLRLETTYWCETYTKALPYLNRHAPPEAVVWAECQDVLVYYQLRGKLRPDLQIANGPDAITAFAGVQLNRAEISEADYVVIQYRQSGFYRAVRRWMDGREPVYRENYRRLRLIEVYEQ
jgi:4-amino-4-deoxy-L-arabinose transferase-like glycosyltransferase